MSDDNHTPHICRVRKRKTRKREKNEKNEKERELLKEKRWPTLGIYRVEGVVVASHEDGEARSWRG